MDHSLDCHHSESCSEVAVSLHYSARLTGHSVCLGQISVESWLAGEFAYCQLLTHTSGQEHFLFSWVNHEISDCVVFFLEFLVQHIILAAYSDSL